MRKTNGYSIDKLYIDELEAWVHEVFTYRGDLDIEDMAQGTLTHDEVLEVANLKLNTLVSQNFLLAFNTKKLFQQIAREFLKIFNIKSGESNE